MQDANMTFIADALMEYSALGRVRARMGNRHATIAPHNVYPCRPTTPTPSRRREGGAMSTAVELDSPPLRGEGAGERWIAIAAASDAEFARLAEVAGHPEWVSDPRFATVVARKRNERALDAAIAAWTADGDADELEAALRRAGVTAASVCDAAAVLQLEHLWQRGILTEVTHPEAGRHAQAGAPGRLSRTPGGVTRPAPLLGEHSREVLARILEIDDAAYERLVALGVTGSGPPD
jgi:crotonobetainyl-CoA:carnitine CoA-transferase CaiB-like acyl-CoA transferase